MKTHFPRILALVTATAVAAQSETRSEPQRNNEPIVLAPVVAQPWYYIEVPGVQIYSQASPEETAEFARTIHEEQKQLSRLVPEIDQPDTCTVFKILLESPTLDKIRAELPDKFSPLDRTVIDAGGDLAIELLGDSNPRERITQEVIANLNARPPIKPPNREAFNRMVEYRLSYRHKSTAGRFIKTYWLRLLGSHRELPEWYRSGLADTLARGLLGTSRNTTEPAIVLQISFVTEGALQRLANPKSKAELKYWPFERFFATSRPDASVKALQGETTEEKRTFCEQSILFLHWGLRNGTKQRESFRRFVAAACEGPVSEDMFKRCFGFDYKEGERRLIEFAKKEIRNTTNRNRYQGAVWPDNRRTFVLVDTDAYRDLLDTKSPREKMSGTEKDFLRTIRLLPDAESEVTGKSLSEIQKMIAEVYLWAALGDEDARLRNQQVISYHPRFGYRQLHAADLAGYEQVDLKEEAPLQAKARNILFKLHDKGEGDPELVFLLGVLELRAGRIAEATRFLQNAVDSHVRRPAAYLTLARLRLVEAMRTPSSGGLHPTEEQLEPVRNMLCEALQMMPRSEPAYCVLANTWGCSGGVPTESDLTQLTKAVRWYPENVRLACEVAVLCERAGQHDQAAVVAKIGLAWADNTFPDDFRAELRRLAMLSQKQV